MNWQLSDSHLSAQFIDHPKAAFYAAALREARRERYRNLVVQSHLTTNLNERAFLQASAAILHRVIYGSAGEFDGAVIALQAEGDDQVDYGDGDTAPLHCTLCFLGNAADMSPFQQQRAITVAERLGQDLPPFDAKVVSPATFGDTEVMLVEHPLINDARDLALSDRTIGGLTMQNAEHPGFLPHVSGLPGGQDSVRFDRVSAMLGGDNHTFALSGTQSLDLDLQDEGVLT